MAQAADSEVSYHVHKLLLTGGCEYAVHIELLFPRAEPQVP